MNTKTRPGLSLRDFEALAKNALSKQFPVTSVKVHYTKYPIELYIKCQVVLRSPGGSVPRGLRYIRYVLGIPD